MKSAIILLAVLGVALSASLTPSAAAATDMFMKIGDVKGESIDVKHKDEIDVLAWSWGMSNSGTTHSGSGGDVGKANVQDFSFTKYVDLSTPDLMLSTLNGQHFDQATFTVQKAGGTHLEFLKITFEEVIVTSVSTGGSGGEDRLTENITLNFAKVKVEYTPQKQDGSGGPTKTITWDIAANTV